MTTFHSYPIIPILDLQLNLMSISVLFVGAGGAFGQPLLKEFIRQKNSFKTIAVLASTEKKIANYSFAEAEGIKIVVGSFLQSKSYEGNTTHCITTVTLSNKSRVHSRHFSCRQ
jgi:hypothetical protein